MVLSKIGYDIFFNWLRNLSVEVDENLVVFCSREFDFSEAYISGDWR